MSRRSYPAWGGDVKLQKSDKTAECEACDKPATHASRIQTSFLRGEDDTYLVCPRHKSMALKNVRRFLAHVATKGKFLAGEKEMQS